MRFFGILWDMSSPMSMPSPSPMPICLRLEETKTLANRLHISSLDRFRGYSFAWKSETTYSLPELNLDCWAFTWSRQRQTQCWGRLCFSKGRRNVRAFAQPKPFDRSARNFVQLIIMLTRSPNVSRMVRISLLRAAVQNGRVHNLKTFHSYPILLYLTFFVQTWPLDRLWRTAAQTTRIGPRKWLKGILISSNFVWRPENLLFSPSAEIPAQSWHANSPLTGKDEKIFYKRPSGLNWGQEI